MPVGFQLGLRLVDWVSSGASVDLDFVNNRFFGSSGGSVTSYLSITRASIGNAKNSAGAWVQFPVNTLRITDLGLLIEGARTNNLLQSETPATQTTASLTTGSYTLWVEGSGSALASGGSATITGAASATDGSPNTFTVTVAGTVVVTVTGSLTRFQLENGVFASSYILTTGTTAARSADAVTCTGPLNTLMTALPQSAVFDVKPTANNFSNNRFMIADVSFAHPSLRMVSGSAVAGNFSGTTFGIGPTFNLGSSLTWDLGAKAGFAQNSGGVSAVGGGGTVSSDTNQAVFPAASRLGNFSGSYFDLYMRRATFWNSKLADATLQAFTAP